MYNRIITIALSALAVSCASGPYYTEAGSASPIGWQNDTGWTYLASSDNCRSVTQPDGMKNEIVKNSCAGSVEQQTYRRTDDDGAVAWVFECKKPENQFFIVIARDEALCTQLGREFRDKQQNRNRSAQ